MTTVCDCVVVGGGIAGAAAAWELAAELDVVVVELEAQPGQHATGRSAALLAETSGPPEVCALAVASRPFLTSPPPAVGGDSLLSPRGVMWVAGPGERAALEPLRDAAARLRVVTDELDAAAAVGHVDALRADWVSAALFEPEAQSIDVARLLDGYLTGARSRGATVRVSSPAVSGRRVDGRWEVTTPQETYSCAVVVDAAGAWADVVAERFGVAPVGLQPMLRTAFTFPYGGAGDWPMVMHIGATFYFEPEGDGLLVSPSDETPSEPCDAIADELAMAKVVDALDEATTITVRGVRARWAGLRTFAPDRLPVIGEEPSAEGFYWFAGQGGAGIKTSPAAAALLSSAVHGRALPAEIAATGLDPARISPARAVTARRG